MTDSFKALKKKSLNIIIWTLIFFYKLRPKYLNFIREYNPNPANLDLGAPIIVVPNLLSIDDEK
ncbi:MAG: hypothetical protein D6732_25920 [Methanobacteriota archaeon]|nr:MAG: hypothetical protein D6732_25920 [Euryarchaeota archaeon]